MAISLKDIVKETLPGKTFTPSTTAWEDQVLYFLMLDRFSDNKEAGLTTNGTTPPFTRQDNGNAVTNEQDAKNWREAGIGFTGGNLKSLRNDILK